MPCALKDTGMFLQSERTLMYDSVNQSNFPAISSRAQNNLLNTDWSKIHSRKFTENCYEPSLEIRGEKIKVNFNETRRLLG